MAQQYIEFIHIGKSLSGKTDIVEVRSISGGYPLGTICWHAPWRCYTLRPRSATIWNHGCLAAVNAQIAAMMDARRG